IFQFERWQLFFRWLFFTQPWKMNYLRLHYWLFCNCMRMFPLMNILLIFALYLFNEVLLLFGDYIQQDLWFFDLFNLELVSCSLLVTHDGIIKFYGIFINFP